MDENFQFFNTQPCSMKPHTNIIHSLVWLITGIQDLTSFLSLLYFKSIAIAPYNLNLILRIFKNNWAV